MKGKGKIQIKEIEYKRNICRNIKYYSIIVDLKS